MTPLPQEGYSATVKLELRVGGQLLEVAQVGADSLILRQPGRLPPGPAELLVTVAGTTEVHPIILAPGDGSRLVTYW